MELRVCSHCLLSKSSHQVNWPFARVNVAGFGPYASQLLYLHSAEYAYSTMPIKQNYIQLSTEKPRAQLIPFTNSS